VRSSLQMDELSDDLCIITDNSRLFTRRWRIHAFPMLGSVSHMDIKVEQ
jgi:hypothetical protein